ncbi:hypothetical protein ACFWPK_22315 [Nocardia sp. NPDC058519]|uniref:hypothetical protein n=1 Tax=Nocardia sp. NPDC058519 TaxID=3346535 RepID=UPI0036583505
MLEEASRKWFVVLAFGAYPIDTVEDAMLNLMDALLDSKTVTDADVTAAGRTGDIEVSVYIEALSPAKAITGAMSAVSEAIHRSGGLAQEWDEAAEAALQSGDLVTTVRPADLVCA